MTLTLVSIFFFFFATAGFSDSELVKDAISSRNIELPSHRAGLLDEIALALDARSLVLANWSRLALQLGVPRKELKEFERRSMQSPTNNMFEYLAATRPQMTLKTVKDALALMYRNDVLRILYDQNLEGKLLHMASNMSSILFFSIIFTGFIRIT